MTVAVLVYDGVSAFEAVGALAAARAAGLDADLASEDAIVASREGARLVPARLGLDAVERADAAVVPGGDVERQLRSAPLARALRARRGRWTLASGEGVRLAQAAGLTEGRRVAGPTTARLVADGRLLTSVGGDTIVDLVLHYAAAEGGPAVAVQAAQALGREYQPFVMGA